ncbi:MAG: sigma-70 family RNA polymerase sigma factor [Oscillospiraceae bacterium]|nr:sigma-70 family RNA polymerase sigma factor [Oscillospiraceae bacterium]
MTDYSAYSDIQLLRLAGAGDRSAEDALILRYRCLVRSCTRPYFLAGGDREDLVQEGMIGLISAMREFDPSGGASFRTYAELCIRRRVISAAKSASRQKHAPLNDGISLDEILSEENQNVSFFTGQRFARSPEDQMLARERERDFYETYSRYLSAFEAEILEYYLKGLSYQEIGDKCGRSLKSVDNAIQRIRNKLSRRFTHGDFS